MNRIGMMISAAAIAACVPLMTACESTRVVATDKQLTYHAYAYFPESEVYYAPDSSTYFWREKNLWIEGRALPERYQISGEGSISLQLSTDRPYERHAEISAIYPPQQHFANDR